MEPEPQRAAGQEGARERVLRAAYELFARHGVAAVGIDRIVAESGVAKASLYRHFRSKEELVVAALSRREELWTSKWLEAEVERRGGTPEERLLAIFDVFDGWFRRPDYEACMFVNVLMESHDLASPIGAAATKGLVQVRELPRRLAQEAGFRDPDGFAQRWQLLMLGSIVAAAAGDLEGARQARDLGSLMLERERAG